MSKTRITCPGYFAAISSLLLLTLSTAAIAKPSEPPKKRPLITRARDLAIHGKVEEAKILLDKILAKQPENAEAWYLLGTALSRLDRLPEARLALECSLSLEPARAAARERLADVANRGAPAAPSSKPCSADRP